MAIGGMYNILSMISKNFTEDEPFEKKDIEDMCDICMQSVTNNLTRLCNAGLLEKEEVWIHKGMGNTTRSVKYKLTMEAKEFIKSLICDE